MVTSTFNPLSGGGNKPLRYCFIMFIVMPSFAASSGASLGTGEALRASTVVRADPKTGKLVRSVVAPRVTAPAPRDLAQIVDKIAAEQGVEVPLVHSVIRAESNYNPNAVSPKGALGLMQLIPSTARRFGVADAFDARENIEGGVRYLRFLLDYYRNDYTKAIAAYNAGEAAVDKYQGIPPYAETRNYLVRVAKNLKAAREKQSVARPVAPSAGRETTKVETYRPIQASVGSDGRIYYRTP